MLGLIEEGPRFSCAVQRIDGVPFCMMTLPRSPLALRRGVRALRRQGVRRCVFSEGVSPAFTARGFSSVDARALLRKKAGIWTLTQRQARGLHGSIALLAPRLTPQTEQTVRQLLRHTASVSLPRSEEAERLQTQLRRESGAVLRLCPERELADAETLLLLTPVALEGRALTLCVERSPLPRFILPSPWEESFSPRLDHAALSAALWELGCVDAEKIGLRDGI